MTIDQKALAAALRAYWDLPFDKPPEVFLQVVISAYLAALPALEPVAWRYTWSTLHEGKWIVSNDRLPDDDEWRQLDGFVEEPLYASPPSHQGLREAQSRLNPEYVETARKRIETDAGMFGDVA